MCAAEINESAPALQLLDLAGAFSAPEGRGEAAERLADLLGGESLLLFSPDPELGVLLPAPGLPQSLTGASRWRSFLELCQREGTARGRLPDPDGGESNAVGASAGNVVAVLTGAQVAEQTLDALRPLLPLLGALFLKEREVAAVEVRGRAADDAVDRARLLTRALTGMRERLEQALGEAEEARREAKQRAEHAESLAEELRTQAGHLEEQATELEILNEALAVRSEEADRARRAADEANRAKSELLANMSHELRTPINAVLGFEELLTMQIDGPLNDSQRSHLQRIRSSSRHLLTLINDILDLAKVEAGQLSVVHERETLDVVLDEAMALVQMQFDERGVALEHGCDDPAPVYYGDRDRVRQIILNLLSNAMKFTEPGGAVTIHCGTTAVPASEAALHGSARWAVVQVEDTGIGISAEDSATIFQPFGQVEQGRTRRKGGTGLGLTISRQLARLMGGDLTLRSELGAGSCFSLWLPADNPVHGELDPAIRIPDQ